MENLVCPRRWPCARRPDRHGPDVRRRCFHQVTSKDFGVQHQDTQGCGQSPAVAQRARPSQVAMHFSLVRSFDDPVRRSMTFRFCQLSFPPSHRREEGPGLRSGKNLPFPWIRQPGYAHRSRAIRERHRFSHREQSRTQDRRYQNR
jgi:hypothetical protein